MRRSVTLGALALLVATASGLYLVEQEVQSLERRLHGLNADLLASQQAIQVLRAEWSYLNQPDRLQDLVSRHAERLQLAPLEPAQVLASLDELPSREVAAHSDVVPRPAFKPPRRAAPGVLLASGGRSI